MKVKLIAATEIDTGALRDIGFQVDWNEEPGDPFGDFDADELAEFAGRNCYQSFRRPNPATAANDDYLDHILQVGHESVLEHASASFYIETSRSVLVELERHRHLSFSVMSQRYVDPVPFGYHVPPAIRDLPEGELKQQTYEVISESFRSASELYDHIEENLSEAGLPRKQAYEAARAVLPNMTSSPMVVSGNHRAWRYVIKNRWHESADAEIRELAGELLRQLREIAPNTYQDIPTEPYTY